MKLFIIELLTKKWEPYKKARFYTRCSDRTPVSFSSNSSAEIAASAKYIWKPNRIRTLQLLPVEGE